MLLKFCAYKLPENFVKNANYDPVGLGQGPRVSNCKKLPSGGDAAGPV